jgi:membrane-bound lytic murein transglycosylase B
MGPAQMMPKTWMAYRLQVSEITGHYPSDPWDLTDAIASMAVKLARIPGVTEGDYNAEYKAAGMYFAGSNWQRFLFYPDKVMLYTNLYAEELN